MSKSSSYAKSVTHSHDAKESEFSCGQPRSKPAAHPILSLQRSHGNAVLGSLLRAGIARAKLRVGPADDPFEREADHVADAVMATDGATSAPL